ncbi:hypothetical protein [Iodobacter sp.]|uniref:hypothetical protein n=1 Tax=Iodobacter sp. TaxID=1915058 RepID=UPI0025F63C25|nr:hypothetical protein [Iodobacter sp.]
MLNWRKNKLPTTENIIEELIVLLYGDQYDLLSMELLELSSIDFVHLYLLLDENEYISKRKLSELFYPNDLNTVGDLYAFIERIRI